MDSLVALKGLHIAALLALLLSGAALALWTLKGQRAGDARIHNRLLQGPQRWGWALMLVCLAILPLSGWWLVHGLGLSLGQTWVLSSSLLYTLGLIAWVWLFMRLLAQAGKGRSSLVLAGIAALSFLAMAILLMARPG